MERTVLSVSYGHKAPLPHSRLFPAVPDSPPLSQPMPPSSPLIGGILMRGIWIGLLVCQNHCPAMDGWPYLPLLKKKKKKKPLGSSGKTDFLFVPLPFALLCFPLSQPPPSRHTCRSLSTQQPLAGQLADKHPFFLTKYFLPELKIPRRKHLEPRREQNINSLYEVSGTGCKQSILTQKQDGLDNMTNARQMILCEPFLNGG